MAGFGGNQMMRPLGQMWSQQRPTGMFPPVGAPQMGQGAPTGQLPPMTQGQPQMTPGGGFTGAPLQMGQMPMQGQSLGYQGFPQSQFHQQVQDWRQQRPQFQGPRPDDFKQQMMAWHGLRPDHPQY